MMLAFTTHSPTSAGDLPSAVTVVGGVVLDLIGKNGARVVSELKATDTFKGYFNSGSPTNFQGNPGTIGIQQGFDSSLVAALGGGLSEVAVRITLYDGDTGPGDFDDGQNWLLLNSVRIGNFSDIVTHVTDDSGNDLTGTATKGFLNDTLDTGFFYSNDPTFLNAFYQTLSQGAVKYQLDDTHVLYDNLFDFTRGIDASLIDVGQGPVVTYSLLNDSAASQAGSRTIQINVVGNDVLPPAITNFTGLYVVNPPTHGTTLIDHSAGTITYTPNAGFSGVDSFTYGFSDPGVNLAPATVEVNVAPATQTGIVLGPATQGAKLGALANLVATVTADNGQPIANRDVTFEVTAGPNAGFKKVVATDQNGQAPFSYTGTVVGTDTVIAHFEDDAGQTQFSPSTSTVAWTNNKFALTPATQELIVNNQAELIATIHADDGSLVVGRDITFDIMAGANQGRHTQTITTDQNGQARFFYTSTVTGSDLVRIVFLDDTGNQQSIFPAIVTWDAQPIIEGIVLDPLSQKLSVDGQATVVATVKTDNGVPIIGRNVNFVITTGPNVGFTKNIATDQNGQASFSYTSSLAGTDTITASFTDDAGQTQSAPASATVVWSFNKFTLSPATQELIVNNQAELIATIHAEDGSLVAGRNVTFDIMAGVNQGLVTQTIPTDQNGQAKFFYTSTKTGSDLIRIRFFDDTGEQQSVFPAIVTWDAEPIIEGIVVDPLNQKLIVNTQGSIVATVKTNHGVPIVSRNVTFTVTTGPNAGLTKTVPTDDTGRASFSYTSAVSGTDTVTASFTDDANQTQSSSATLVWAFNKFTLSPATQALMVNQQAELVATIRSEDGSLVAGRSVTFEIMAGVNQGRVTQTITTDQNGQAKFFYTSTVTGGDLVRIRFLDDAGAQQSVFPAIVTWIAEPVTEGIVLAPSSQTRSVNAQSSIVATVTTNHGVPIVGRNVNFEITTGPNAGFKKTIATDSNGQASLSFTSSVAGTDTITASFADDAGHTQSAPTSPTVYWIDEKITLSPGTQKLYVNNQAGLVATIVTASGSPIASRNVTFEITAGPNVGLKKTLTTNQNGQVTLSYTSSLVGTDTIVASFTDAAGQSHSSPSNAMVTWLNAKFTLSPVSQELIVNNQAELVATIHSADGSLVAGRNITFEIMSGVNQGHFTKTIATDQNGQAKFFYTSAVTGVDVVRILFFDEDGKQQSVFPGYVTWDPPIPNPVTITVSPVAQKVNVKDQAGIVATIQTHDGQPIAGREVTFVVTDGPNAGLKKVVTTDQNGHAELFLSSFAPGNDTITASFIDDASKQQSADPSTVTWFEDETITLTPDTQTLLLGDDAALVATIQRADGEPIANREVTFEITAGPNAGLKKTIATDQNGQAKFAYTSTLTGVDVIVARFTDEANQQLSTQTSNTVLWSGKTPSTDQPNTQPPSAFINPITGLGLKPELLLLLLRPVTNPTPNSNFIGAGLIASPKTLTSTVGEPLAIDAAFGSDEIDKTVLLANFLDFVEPEALIVDLGDEPPAKISVDFVKTSAVEVLKPADKPANDAPVDTSRPSGGSNNVPGMPVNELKSTDGKSGDQTNSGAGSTVSTFFANNWRLFAGGAAAVLLFGAAWTSRSKWFRIARKLRSR